jgi:hypothetical protein
MFRTLFEALTDFGDDDSGGGDENNDVDDDYVYNDNIGVSINT